MTRQAGLAFAALSSAGPKRTDEPVHVLRETSNIEDKSAWAPYGAGGVWRRQQLDGILRRNGAEPVNLDRPPPVSLLRKLLNAGQTLTQFWGKIEVSPRAIALAAYTQRLYQYNSERSGLAPVAILEWGTDPIAIPTLRGAGFRVVVTLMAIGSLWRDRPSPVTGPYPKMYLTEVESLRLADAIFCISREEQWLLSNLGIGAHYLPYFPDKDRELSLLAEREARPPASEFGKTEFLICATRGNTDTVESFQEQVSWIIEAHPEEGPTFHVTGNQTEALREVWSDPRFVFHGTCSDEAFVEVKRRCKAICLHQKNGLGAVTRIPDMALSGLRIISNGVAARSFIGMEGVHIYDTPGQFRNLLERDFSMPPPPQRPLELEDGFFASLFLKPRSLPTTVSMKPSGSYSA